MSVVQVQRLWKFVICLCFTWTVFPEIGVAEIRYINPGSGQPLTHFKQSCSYKTRLHLSGSEFGGPSPSENTEIVLPGASVHRWIDPSFSQNAQTNDQTHLEVPISLSIAQRLLAQGYFLGQPFSDMNSGSWNPNPPLSFEEALAAGRTIYSPRLSISQYEVPQPFGPSQVVMPVELVFNTFNPEQMVVETIHQSNSSSPQEPAGYGLMVSFLEDCPDPSDLSVYHVNASSEYGTSYSASNLTDGNENNYWISAQGMTDHIIQLELDEPSTVKTLELNWYSDDLYTCETVELRARNPWGGFEEYQTIASGFRGAQEPGDGVTKLHVVEGGLHPYMPATSSFQIHLSGCDTTFTVLKELHLKGFIGEGIW